MCNSRTASLYYTLETAFVLLIRESEPGKHLGLRQREEKTEMKHVKRISNLPAKALLPVRQGLTLTIIELLVTTILNQIIAQVKAGSQT